MNVLKIKVESTNKNLSLSNLALLRVGVGLLMVPARRNLKGDWRGQVLLIRLGVGGK